MEALEYKKTHAGGLDNPRAKTSPYIQGVLRKVCKTKPIEASKAREKTHTDVHSSSGSRGHRHSASYGADNTKSSRGHTHDSSSRTVDDEEAYILFDLALHNVLKSVQTPFQLSRIVRLTISLHLG